VVRVLLWLALAAVIAASAATHLWPPVPLVEGVFWQPDRGTIGVRGAWDQIGAHVLVVQWLVVDGRAWYHSRAYPPMAVRPNWPGIARAPWAAHIVAGLVSRSSETDARADAIALAGASRRIVAELPVHPSAYYASVEDDPTWANQRAYRAYLEALPRPLWLSVYTQAGERPDAFALWLQGWLPPDTTVLIQDGVGVGHNTPATARALADAAVRVLGARRVALIVEAFRQSGGGFRPALPWELWSQFTAYRGLRLYVFDGPHYLTGWRLWTLKAWSIATDQHNPTLFP